MSIFLKVMKETSSSCLTTELDTAAFATSEDDKGFMAAVRKNDLYAVREFINAKQVDINCIDQTGRTALQVAVQEKSVAMVAELLRKGADIGHGLLDAIRTASLECVAILVMYDKRRRESLGLTMERRIDTGNRHLKCLNVLTPLVLAAQTENLEITKFLMNQGYIIEDPHAKFCDCWNCTMLGRLGCYVNNLNIYRALASPIYMSLAFLLQDSNSPSKKLDPVYRALVLKRDILKQADIEYEFREDYLQLARKCEDFAVALLEQCNDLDEISLFMTLPGMREVEGVEVVGGTAQQKKLSVFNFAIKCSSKKLIAHRYSQVMLNSVVYHGLRGIEEKNIIINGLLVLVYWLFMPIFMLMYQCLPTNSLTRVLEVPMVKYIGHLGSMVWFVVLMFIAAFQDKLSDSDFMEISVIDVLVGVWVAGMLVEELKQAKRQGKERYIAQWWHLVTILVVVLFVIAGITWISSHFILLDQSDSRSLYASFLQEANFPPRTLLLLSHCFYSAALVLTFFQASHNFQVSYVFGPLHRSMTNMAGDVLKFFVIFSLNVVAFSIGIRKLYSQYVETVNNAVNSGKDSNLTSIGNRTLTHKLQAIEGTFGHLFWALFGLADVSLFETQPGFQITAITGQLMFAAYIISALLVALNVLIAMLSNTFQEISKDQDVAFKVARTQILMQYVNRGSVCSSPFNLIPFKESIRYIHSLCTSCAMPDFKEAVYKYSEDRRNRFMRLLILRYLLQRNEKWSETSPEIPLGDVIADNSENETSSA